MLVLNPITTLAAPTTDARLSVREARRQALLAEEAKKEQSRAAIRAKEEDPNQMTERKMLVRLANHFDNFRNKIFVRSHLLGWEMDFCMVTGSRVLHEIEVKISVADWRVDQHKDKWKNPNQDKVGRFWYAVPGSIIDKMPDFVPPTTGLIAVSAKHLTVYRPAELVSKYKVTDAELNRLYESMYFRWWRQALKGGEV